MSFIKQAKEGVFWTFLQQFSVQIINFGVQIVLARLLMPSDFGLVAMIAIFISLGQSLSDSGMTSSLIRNKKNSDEDYYTVFVTNILVSIVIYGIVFVISPVVAMFYEEEILTNLLRVYGLVFVISSFSVVQVARFAKNLNFKSQFTYQLPSVVLGAIVGVLMAKNDFGVWSLVGLNVSQAVSFSLILWVFYSWRPRFLFDKRKFRYHFDYGYKLTLSGIIDTIYLNLYKIIIGKKFEPQTVGFFTQADNLRIFPVYQLSVILNKVTFPLFANIQDDNIKLKKAYKSVLRLVLSCTSAIMLVLILLAEPIFLFVFGEKWLPSVPYFQILCVASIFWPIGTYNLSILKIKGRSDLFLKVEIIKKIIGVISLILAIPFGIEAIVWTLCVTNIFFAYLNGYFSGKFIEYRVLCQLKNSVSVIIVATIPFGLLAFSIYINGWFLESSVFNILIYTALYLLMYFPLVYLLNKPVFSDIKLILKK